MTNIQRTTETPPLLHGDGVTDDTEAVQWYLANQVPLPPSEKGYVTVLSKLAVPNGTGLAKTGGGYSASSSPVVDSVHL